MSISFENIPTSIRKPGKYVEFNTSLAVRTLPQNRQKLLIIGQRTSGGSVAQKTPTEIYSDVEAAEYFGYGSHCHLMARAAVQANPYAAMTVCALDDAAAGVQATGTITISAAAAATGTLSVWIGNRRVNVAVTKNDANTAIATALAAAINADPLVPVTASASTNVVTLTAKNAGTIGNQIDLAYETTNSCVTCTISAMASGATDPDIQDALDAVYSEQYHIIATALNDQTSLESLRDHLDEVSGPLEQRPGVGVYGYDGVLAACTSLAGNINSGRVVCAYLRGTRSMPMELGSAMAAMLAWEEDPARPLNTLELKKIHAPDIGDRLSRTEQESCLYNGVTPLEVGPGEKVQIVRAVTTYTKDANNVDDISLLDVTTIRTLDYVRKAVRERIALRYPRAKLSSRTPARVKSDILHVLLQLEELEIVEEVAANRDGVLVEKNTQDPNRLDAKIPVDIVNGLHVFAGRIDLLL